MHFCRYNCEIMHFGVGGNPSVGHSGEFVLSCLLKLIIVYYPSHHPSEHLNDSFFLR